MPLIFEFEGHFALDYVVAPSLEDAERWYFSAEHWGDDEEAEELLGTCGCVGGRQVITNGDEALTRAAATLGSDETGPLLLLSIWKDAA